MPYRRKEIYSGMMLEVEIFPITEKERKQPRKDKLKETSKKQKNLNDKNAKKHLIRLINTNFTDSDLAVHLTYSDGNYPKSDKEAKRDVVNFLRRVKNYRNKNGLDPLKYIAVIEYREKEENQRAVRMHHHIIMSGMDRDIVESLWGKGRANADRLKSDEYGYEAIGRYITKDPKGNRRWTQSKNLKKPIVRVNDYEIRKRKAEELARNPEDRDIFESMYPGYIFNNCDVKNNEDYGTTYIYIKMRKLKK